MLLDLGLDRSAVLQRVGAGREADRDAGAGLAVEPAVGICSSRRRARPGRRRQADTIAPLGSALTMMLRNCSGVWRRDWAVTVALSICPAAAAVPPISPAATSAFCALIALIDVARHQREGREPGRIEPDAHRIGRAEHVDVADAGDAADRILHVARQIVGRRPCWCVRSVSS